MDVDATGSAFSRIDLVDSHVRLADSQPSQRPNSDVSTRSGSTTSTQFGSFDNVHTDMSGHSSVFRAPSSGENEYYEPISASKDQEDNSGRVVRNRQALCTQNSEVPGTRLPFVAKPFRPVRKTEREEPLVTQDNDYSTVNDDVIYGTTDVVTEAATVEGDPTVGKAEAFYEVDGTAGDDNVMYAIVPEVQDAEYSVVGDEVYVNMSLPGADTQRDIVNAEMRSVLSELPGASSRTGET